jgi:hypothetical protein
MTKADKPVRRESYSCFRGRPIIVTIHPTFVTVRLKGQRTKFTVTVDQLYTLGAKTAAVAAKAEREAKRKALRAERSK